MSNTQQELVFDLCWKHKDLNLEPFYPNYAFNILISFPGRECEWGDCEERAYYRAVGLSIPQGTKELSDSPKSLPNLEVFKEAQQLISGIRALEGITYYLETRILPNQERSFLANKLTRNHARLLLKELKMDPEKPLQDRQIHKILKYLGMYNEDLR